MEAQIILEVKKLWWIWDRWQKTNASGAPWIPCEGSHLLLWHFHSLSHLFKHHSGPESASLLFPVAFTITLSNHKTSAVSRYYIWITHKCRFSRRCLGDTGNLVLGKGEHNVHVTHEGNNSGLCLSNQSIRELFLNEERSLHFPTRILFQRQPQRANRDKRNISLEAVT